jgi:hypothetical protein
MDFFRFCILMPEFEECIVNSSSIDLDDGHCQISLRRLPITTSCPSSSYVYVSACVPQATCPFLYRTSSSDSQVQANAVAVQQAIQDVCIATFVKMFVFTFHFPGDQCLVLTTCQISYVYVFIEVEGTSLNEVLEAVSS